MFTNQFTSLWNRVILIRTANSIQMLANTTLNWTFLFSMQIRRTAPGAVPATVHGNMATSVSPLPDGEILNQVCLLDCASLSN